MALNYFVYKAGVGNCWLPLAKRGHGLYVGFSDETEPTKQNPHPIRIRVQEDPQFQPLTGGDDDNVSWLTHRDNQKDSLLLVFDTQNLLMYEVTGPLGVHGPAPPRGTYEEAQEYFKNVYSGKVRGRDKRFKDYAAALGDEVKNPVFKTLPVSLVATVPRSSLYTSVDSLSVYQGLNRGTCRRLWRATGPTQGGFPESLLRKVQGRRRPEAEAPYTPRIPRWDDKLPTGEETPFGAFVRLYLNDLLTRYGTSKAWRTRGRAEQRLSQLGESQVRQLAFASFNPILVETAAFYFCLDLGLLPDVGTGKGFEHVDVRARAEPGCDVEKVLKKLKAIKTLSLSGEAEENIRKGTLELQCKASDKGGVAKHLLYFGYRKGGPDGAMRSNTVHLPALLAQIDEGGWEQGLLRRFVQMQERVIRSVWEVAE